MTRPDSNRVFVVGVGMTRFCKPQKKYDPKSPQYPEYGKVAVERALEDCGLGYHAVEAAVLGSVSNATGKGQRVLYQLGMTGIPIHNVSNACATGSNALFLCRQLVSGGVYDCALALGLEIMKPGPLGGVKESGPSFLDNHLRAMVSAHEYQPAPLMPQMFGNAGREHQKLYGSTDKHLAMIASKNHKHSLNNPYSQFRTGASVEDVEASPVIYEPLKKLMCSPTSDGAAAVIVCSERFVKKHGLEGQAVEILAQSMKTDLPSAFTEKKPDTCINMVGFGMAQAAASEAFNQCGLTPNDVQVVELHDCFASNELITYEALGLAPVGRGHKLVEKGDNTYGGKWVVNPSGGLESKGHPIGATGVAQCCELTWQLRGQAGPRQVPNAKVGLQHNLGLGGAVVVSIYRKPEEWRGVRPKVETTGSMGFGEKMKARL